MASRAARRQQMKPAVTSRTSMPRMVRAQKLPPLERSRRPRPQFAVPPPGMAGPDHDVGAVLGELEHGGQVGGVVAAVGVHLDEVLVAAARPQPKPST